jgi:hypothetical protein
MDFLTKLDRDIEITIKKRPSSRNYEGGRIVVLAD